MFGSPFMGDTKSFAFHVSEVDMNPHHTERRPKPTLLPWLLLAIFTAVVGTVIAIPPQGTREIFSDDFTKNRPAAKSTDSPKGLQGQSPSGATKPKPHRYRLASQPIKKPGPRTGLRPKRQPPLENIIAQLGITIWRLRPVKVTGSDTRALIREKRASSGWVPERVEADTTFREGDPVRLSTES